MNACEAVHFSVVSVYKQSIHPRHISKCFNIESLLHDSDKKYSQTCLTHLLFYRESGKWLVRKSIRIMWNLITEMWVITLWSHNNLFDLLWLFRKFCSITLVCVQNICAYCVQLCLLAREHHENDSNRIGPNSIHSYETSFFFSFL